MPLVVYSLGAYVLGLYTGFAASPLVGFIALSAAVLVGWTRARAAAAGLVLLTIAGIGVARSETRDEDQCVERAGQADSITVVIADSIAPGGFSRGRLAPCGASIALSVAEGAADAGSTVRARGAVLRSQRGLIVQDASIVVVEKPPILSRMRSAAGRAIDRTFRGDAPLVRALLIADRGDLSPEIRDRFAAAGLAHILAIAGLHIGFIVVALSLAFELAGVSRQHAAVATIVVIVGYVAMIGAPVPAVRSATMLSVLLGTRVAQRPTSRWAIVALGAGHAVIDPRVVLDVGYQLSVVGVASMIAAGLLGKRLGLHRLSELPKWVALTLLGTTIATIGSAPIVAWVFGRLSVVAPLSNLGATPLIALAQPMIFLGLLVSPIQPLAHFVADAAHPLLAGLDQVAMRSAALPHASIDVAPSLIAAAIAGAMSFAVIVAAASREWERPALLAAASLTLLIWLPSVGVGRGEVELHMIDVGQGDAVALRTPHGHWILFDAGGAWRGGDAGKSIVVPYIGHRGGPLDAFVLSHPHTDHVGGAVAALRMLHPPLFIDAGFPGPAESYRQSLATARDEHIRWERARPGERLEIDGVSLTVLAPDSAWTASLDDPNLASVVVLARYGDVRMLFMGDAERPEEEWLLRRARGELAADILKVGHHGSKTSSSDDFLAAVRPRLALVSVGAGNMYHLPTPAIMARLESIGAQVVRTDRVGTIVARTDGHRIRVAADGDEWELSDISYRR
jgi:competence protein ComEC